jgi:MarR family transcriptional regulator, organic hydroperoxide resistance regulator
MATRSHTPAKLTTAQEAWGLFFQLALRNRGRLVDALTGLGLTFPQAHLLRLLTPDQPRPMSDVAVRLVCDASNVTGLADRLEARGLIERRSAEHDRRVKVLALTEAGERVREQVIRAMQEPPAVIEALPAADKRALRDILRRALEAAEAG